MKRLLVVDDDPRMRRVLEILAGKIGLAARRPRVP